MTTVPTDGVTHTSGQPADTALVSLAIEAAGPPLPSALGSATETDRGMAAYDLAACIRSAAALLTRTERAAFAAYLTDGAR
jgi:hypothetical protein